MTPATFSPMATMIAPVSVAMSTIASGFDSAARDNPSAKIRRPSASVLWISTVLPLRIVKTSPSLSAPPEGMLSVHIKYAVTLVLHFSDARVLIVANTAAAPLISIFMTACESLLGFRLIPPESYITPLPTSTIFAPEPAGA